MNKYRKNLLPLRVTATLLAGANRAFDHWIDDFEVRRIECQRYMDIVTGRFHVRRKAFVVFHITGALEIIQIIVTLEFFEQHFRCFA